MNTKRYEELFRAESRERLAERNTSLLALERGEGVERVAELFRAVHTVKGMSAAMGYDAVRNLSHALETLLVQLRRGQILVTTGVIAVLFDAVDTLDATIAAVSRPGVSPVDIQPSIAALEAISTSNESDEIAGTNPTMEWPVMASSMNQTSEFAIAGSAPNPTSEFAVVLTAPGRPAKFVDGATSSRPGERAQRFVKVEGASSTCVQRAADGGACDRALYESTDAKPFGGTQAIEQTGEAVGAAVRIATNDE